MSGLSFSRCLLLIIQVTYNVSSLLGAAFMFLLLHTSLLWFGHVVAMFTKIKWPLGARKIALAGYYKYLHTLCLLASTIVSTLPVAVVLNTSGFATFTFPPLFCTPTNREMTFYCIILPVSILIAIGASLLIVILWIIHQVSYNSNSHLHAPD